MVCENELGRCRKSHSQWNGWIRGNLAHLRSVETNETLPTLVTCKDGGGGDVLPDWQAFVYCLNLTYSKEE